MKFLDYEKIIRDNYPILIESYVKQYGEEYRGRITSILERLKYCFFVTPTNLVEYAKRKKNEDYMKAILDSFSELGINVDEVFIDEESLEFEDSKIGTLISIFFPDLENPDKLKENGIFSFRSEYDSLEWDNPIIIERLKLLEALKKKRTDVFDKDYVGSVEYKSRCLFMRQYLKVFERNFDKWVGDYDDVLDYAEELDQKSLEIGRKYEKEYMIALREHLSENDKMLIDSGKDFVVSDLESYPLYFDLSLVEDDFCFPDGPIDYFHSEYTFNLLDEDTEAKEKEIIINMRLQYLEGIGYDTSNLDISSLYCDWYELDYLKDYLPNKEYIEEMWKLKQEKYDLFEYEAAKLCIINDFELDKDDSEIGTIIDGDGHSWSLFYRGGEIDTKNFSHILCLNPFMDTYNLFDIAIDHEMRHAIEMRMKKIDGKILLKTGCDLTLFDSKLENGQDNFTDLNERITQRLSVESTNDRWKKGQFIFSDKYALKTLYPCSIYDYDFDNLDIIFIPFKDEIIKAQISPSFNKIFETIPRRDLRKIDSLITNHSTSSIRRLKAIRRKLMKRKIDKNLVKKDNVSVKVKKKGSRNG